METEKRIRREIANSNERRRMQSINTGFNSLRTMLPKHDGEKLSKAAILQHTAEYIDSLEQEKTRLLAQQVQLKRLVTSLLNGTADIKDLADHHLVKKMKTDHHDTDSADEGICNASPVDVMDTTDDLKAELIEVRKTVDRERKLRMQLEDTVKQLEQQLHPERVKEITHQVQVKLHQQYNESMDNSENENDMAVASLVDYDENVIAETIEIETRSCPGSPQQQQQLPTTIVIQGPNNTFTANPIQFRTAQGQVIKVEPAKGNTVTRAVAGRVQVKGANNPAAIALPIEMPYISAPAAGDQKNNTVTVQILNGGSSSSNAGDQPQTSHTQSRHNLETIVEAIRHLEGDHMFKDDAESNVAYDEEEIVATEEVVTETPAPQIVTTTAKPVASVSSERLGAIRQKVISKNSSRPGVIVAKIK